MTADQVGGAEFLEAVEPHRDVLAMLAARLAPQATPGAVVQDAYGLARRHWSGFEPERGSRRSWLLAITADCAHAARPRRGRAAAPMVRVHNGEGEQSPVADALGALPDRHRFAVDCVYFVGLSIEETAALMRVPERTVRSVLTDAQRRIRGALDTGGRPPEELMRSAGATWRDGFRRAELLRSTAAQEVSARIDHEEGSADTAAGALESPADAAGPAGPASETDPASRPRRKRAWLLPAVVGVVLLLVVGALAVVAAVKAADVAALERQDRDLQLCGQIPPRLDGVTVTRIGQPSGDHFTVRSVARTSMSVYAAQVTGIDATGRIGTYVKHDVVTQNFLVVAVVESPGQPATTRTSVAQDRCDGMTTGPEGLTDHLIVYAFADSRSLVMDAGPVDELDVSEG